MRKNTDNLSAWQTFLSGAREVWGLWAVIGLVVWIVGLCILSVYCWPVAILWFFAAPVVISFATGKGWIDLP